VTIIDPGTITTDKSLNIAIVTALFNPKITKALEAGAIAQLAKHGLEPYARVYVPGAVELPLAAKNLLEIKNVDAVVALGLVIRGETTHYDYVCQAAERGCSQLQLEYNKPVAFGVLTTENREQAEARAGGAKGNKGAESLQVVLDMCHVLGEIRNLNADR